MKNNAVFLVNRIMLFSTGVTLASRWRQAAAPVSAGAECLICYLAARGCYHHHSDNKFQLPREDSYNRDQGNFGSYTKRNAVQRAPRTGECRLCAEKKISRTQGSALSALHTVCPIFKMRIKRRR